VPILVLLAHPSHGSLSHAIAARAVATLESAGHEVVFHDLYAERFDPVLPAEEAPEEGIVDPGILEHCAELTGADGLVIVHPNWWGQPPAILKGWIDRVVRPGRAFRFEEGDAGDGVPVGLLKAQAALVLTTSNTDAQRELEVFGDPLETLWRNCVFGLCGVTNVRRRNFEIVVTSTAEQRAGWLDEVERLVRETF
jgi:NAD(P)H dehydrogenase (quinone)